MTYNPFNLDEDGCLKARVSPLLEGASIWINSGNLCDPNWSTAEWAPSVGKKLLVMRTRFKVHNDVNLDLVPATFRGIKNGFDGISPNPYWFNRNYNTMLDYLLGCDRYYEYQTHREFIWNYDTPIQLKSSENAKIQLLLNSGIMTGSWAYLSIKFISMAEVTE